MIFLNLVICLLHVVMLINYIKYNVVLALVVTFFPIVLLMFGTLYRQQLILLLACV